MAVPSVTSLDYRTLASSPPSPAPAASASLATALFLGFAVPLALLALMTLVAAWNTEGSTRLFLALFGLGAVLAGAAVSRWLARRIAAPIHEALLAARRITAGDLTGEIEVRGGGEAARLMQSLRDLQGRMFGIVSEVRNGTTTVASTSTQISRDNEALAERTDTQVNSLQDTAASMEELTAAVRQNADNAQQASALALAASQRATHGGAVMADVVQTMGSIRDSSRSIVEIIGVIDGIAFQTNILALNAAVEAARAGEQGRGFAVVAAEVRSLAQRCANAAREVKDLIERSVEQVDAGGRLVDEAGRSMQEIVASVRQVADLIAQIDTGSREQSQGIEVINQAIARMERTTQRNASLVEGAARTANTLNLQAVALMKCVAGFDLGRREYGSAEEAQAMVRAGCEFLRTHGRDALIAEVNKGGQGRFVDRDLYLMVIDDGAVFLAHGNNPRVLKQGPKSRDVDGKLFVQEMVRASRSAAGAWVDYKWAHPVTNEIQVKSTWVQRAGDVVVACGIYKT